MRTLPFLLGALLLLPALLAPSSTGEGVSEAPVFQLVDDRLSFGVASLAARGDEMLAAVVASQNPYEAVVAGGIYRVDANGVTLLSATTLWGQELAVDGAGHTHFLARADSDLVLHRYDGEALTPVTVGGHYAVFGPEGKLYACDGRHLVRIGHGRTIEALPASCPGQTWGFSPGGLLYAVRNDFESQVVRIDVETGVSTPIVTLPGRASGLAFDLQGHAYVVYQPCCQSHGALVRFDPEEPVATVLADLPFPTASDLAFAGSRLWVSAYTSNPKLSGGIGYFDISVTGFGGFQPAPLELPPLPDLIVKSIEVEPVPLATPVGPVRVEPHEQRLIRVTLANKGGGEAGTFNVSMYVSNTPPAYVRHAELEGLAPGAEATIEFVFDTTARIGRYRIEGIVDSFGERVLESDETNNRFQSETVVVTPLGPS